MKVKVNNAEAKCDFTYGLNLVNGLYITRSHAQIRKNIRLFEIPKNIPRNQWHYSKRDCALICTATSRGGKPEFQYLMFQSFDLNDLNENHELFDMFARGYELVQDITLEELIAINERDKKMGA